MLSESRRSLPSSSPHTRTTATATRPNIPRNTHFNSSSSSTGTRTTPSQMNSYYSNSPAARDNPFLRRNELDRHNHDSSTTIYSSSHQSDSLYNEPTRQHTPRILTTSMNNRWKTTDSPSYNRKNLSPLPKTQDNDDDNDHQPRQILLPIGGGVVGKLASSTTNLSYRKCRFISEHARSLLEIARLSFLLSILGSSNSAEHSPMNHPHRKSSSNVYKDELVRLKPLILLPSSFSLLYYCLDSCIFIHSCRLLCFYTDRSLYYSGLYANDCFLFFRFLFSITNAPELT